MLNGNIKSSFSPNVLLLSRVLIAEEYDFDVMVQSYIAGRNIRNILDFTVVTSDFFMNFTGTHSTRYTLV